MELDEAISIIVHDSGRHFDPEVVSTFKGMAANLYVKIACANGQDLRHEMREVLGRYFKTHTALQ
jgi:HD-GYP domain-containing protein (c-di-GMP phosphodiesterase class II)